LCVVTTILPFVIYSAIPIGAVVIWLVARSVMRSEIRASNQLVERRREEWRAGGCVGPEPGKYRGPERSDWRGWFAGGGPGMGGGGGGGCGGGGNWLRPPLPWPRGTSGAFRGHRDRSTHFRANHVVPTS